MKALEGDKCVEGVEGRLGLVSIEWEERSQFYSVACCLFCMKFMPSKSQRTDHEGMVGKRKRPSLELLETDKTDKTYK